MKLNEFMLNMFMWTRDIIVDLWPHWLVTGFLNWRPQIESWQRHWFSFMIVINIFEFWGFFFDVLNIFLIFLSNLLKPSVL